SGNHTFEMVRQSKECTINVPTLPLIDKVVGIGNCSGADTDKFEKFELTRADSREVEAPSVGECHANLECRLVEDKLVPSLNFFVFEVVAARAAPRPKYPKTFHYYGEGKFMTAGPVVDRSRLFKPSMLL
ncbi:MAG TPA: flavin reductase, partial [Rhizomicrobium sp.]|nr:flavin reductase [Rhizomicrobium sp.]